MTTYRLPIEIEHALPNWPLVDFRKKSTLNLTVSARSNLDFHTSVFNHVPLLLFGYMDNDGYFYITDRKKDLIIVGGFNVFPREIDELIYQHSKVKEGISVGIPDPRKGEHIKVYIVLKDGETADARRVHRLLQGAAHAVQGAIRGRVPQGIAQKHDWQVLRRALREEEIRKTKEGQRL